MLRAFAALLLALAGCLGTDTPSSGVYGIATIGPTCPVEQDPPEPGCDDRPYTGRLAVVTERTARITATFEPAADGAYNVSVAPGRYAIRAAGSSSAPPTCTTEPFDIPRGAYVEVLVRCDSGIR